MKPARRCEHSGAPAARPRFRFEARERSPQEAVGRGGEREDLRGDECQEGRWLASVSRCFPEGVTLRSRVGRQSVTCNGKGG
jgi:hypothetical protein